MGDFRGFGNDKPFKTPNFAPGNGMPNRWYATQ
jgi:hypothetical protein